MKSSRKDANKDGAKEEYETLRRRTRIRMQKEFDTLHREMEIAEHATCSTGNRKRTLSRKDSLIRTQKRKLLEKDDRDKYVISVVDENDDEGGGNASKRLRGAKAAFDDDVLRGSSIFGSESKCHKKKDGDGNEEIEESVNGVEFFAEQSDHEDNSAVDDNEPLGVEQSGHDDNSAVDDDEPLGDGEEEDEEEMDDDDGDDDDYEYDDDKETDNVNVEKKSLPQEQFNETSKLPSLRQRTTEKAKIVVPKSGKRRKRILHQLRGFKSFRMAQRHGDALSAHARGLSKVAIEKLKAVANDVPAAPQVYSSLGLVYENMLKDDKDRNLKEDDEEGQSNQENNASLQKERERGTTAAIKRTIEIAKKAYGSYHVAALLCKKDFSLWVRAADSAMEIVELYTKMIEITHSTTINDSHEGNKNERKKWIEEANKDYATADNLKPPGIDVPAKLATTHMQLGNLSEALTILVDLARHTTFAQNDESSSEGAGPPNPRKRSEFERSYKAWLLYADLMLRIGYECTQWNKGIENNQNYMFRRWLRKNSTTYDWQEIRLRALCLALESAAGSKSCSNLTDWAKQRAYVSTEKEGGKEAKAKDVFTGKPTSTLHSESPASIDQGGGNQVQADGEQEVLCARPFEKEQTGNITKQEFEMRRLQLLSSNKFALANFDKETKAMELHYSPAIAKERKVAREALVKKHRQSIVRLVGEFHQSNRSVHGSTNNVPPGRSLNQNEADPLPISASCGTVCSIASELMKHCLSLKLYNGARLVGEAVSCYLKERASICERRRCLNHKQRSSEKCALMQLESYDEIRDSSDESDEEDETLFLSDDEEFEKQGGQLLRNMKGGVLPHELQVLYAMSLYGLGGRNFMASKSITAIKTLELQKESCLINNLVDTEVKEDESWQIFRYKYTATLDRISAFSLLSDILNARRGEAKEWPESLVANLFQVHAEHLREKGILNEANCSSSTCSIFTELKTMQIIKTLLFAIHLKLSFFEHEIMNSSSEKSPSIPRDTLKDASIFAQEAITEISNFLSTEWNIEYDGSIPSSCIEMLNVMARLWSLLLKVVESNSTVSDSKSVRDMLSQFGMNMSLLCGLEIPGFNESQTVESHPIKSWVDRFPVSDSWQKKMQRGISKCAHNLCVASNVSLFSGWESEEFDLNFLKARDGHRYFGINIKGDHVMGILSNDIEMELLEQWRKVAVFLPWTASIDLLDRMKKFKASEWHKDATARLESSCKYETVAAYGEEDGIKMLLAFSRVCLFGAQTVTDTAKDNLVKTALSVLLPISQFCSPDCLWDSPIGRPTTNNRKRWWSRYNTGPASQPNKDFTRTSSKEKKVPNDKSQLPTGTRTQLNSRVVGRKLSERHKKASFSNLVQIPVSVLLNEWTNHSLRIQRKDVPEDAKEAMKKVDIAMRRLRSCSSIVAMQKTSIQVAAALLDVATTGSCHNPFACLQQAAMFASQGSKRGNNDDYFKEALPSQRDCTPLEALKIIGRADCLQAITFPNEAIFLCSYVAKVCRLRRDTGQHDMPWTSEWQVVSICVYNISVAIELTLRSQALVKDYRKQTIDNWEQIVQEELSQGKRDGINLLRRAKRMGGSFSSFDHNMEENEGSRHYDKVVEFDNIKRQGRCVENNVDNDHDVYDDDIENQRPERHCAHAAGVPTIDPQTDVPDFCGGAAGSGMCIRNVDELQKHQSEISHDADDATDDDVSMVAV